MSRSRRQKPPVEVPMAPSGGAVPASQEATVAPAASPAAGGPAAPGQPSGGHTGAHAASPAPQAAKLGYAPVTLPSRGLLYGPDNPIVPSVEVPGGVLQMRKMRADESLRLGSQGGNPLEKIEAVVNACVQYPQGFSPQDLLLTDSLYLMLQLRTMTFGPDYEFTWRCRFCSSIEKGQANIVEDLDQTVDDDLREPVELDLKDASVRVGARFLRIRDRQALVKHTRREKMRSVAADDDPDSAAYRIALMLVSRNGSPFRDVLEKQDFVSSLSAPDVIRFQRFMDDKESGVDLRVYTECSACSAPNEIALPFDADFFRPSNL